jgi:hypothetical protein
VALDFLAQTGEERARLIRYRRALEAGAGFRACENDDVRVRTRSRTQAHSGLDNYLATLTNFQPDPSGTVRELAGEGSKYSTTK